MDSAASRRAWIYLGLIAINLAVYASVRRFELVNYDDALYITEPLPVSRGLTWQGVIWALTTGYAANWHPLTWLSHMLDVQAFGMNPGAFHVVNLLLHTANTLLLFGLLCKMTAAAERSAVVAAFFAVHPLHVESVAWVAERKDVLSTLFFLLALWAYAAYVQRPGRSRYGLVLLLFALGLMAKPMLVTFPFVLLLLDVWPLRRGRASGDSQNQAEPAFPWRALILEKLPMVGLSVAASVVAVLMQQRRGATPGLGALPLLLRMENALVSYVAYIGNTLWPAHLAAFYPYPASIPGWRVAAAALVLGAVSAAVLLNFRGRPYLSVGWLWYLGTLVPVSGLVQIGSQARADRYTYIPLIGLFILLTWGAADLLAHWRCQRFALAAAVLLIAACGVATRRQAEYWRNSTALWSHALAVTTGNYTAHNLLGAALADGGNTEGAVTHYAEALRIQPRYADAHYNLGVALASQGKVAEAAAHYAEALRINPGYAEAHNNLGILLAEAGRVAEATEQYTQALRSKEDYAEARANLGAALASQGRYAEAIAQYVECLRLRPDSPEVHNNLANALVRAGRPAEAISHYAEALRLRPDYAEARVNFGITLAGQGKREDAARQFSAALRINPQDARARSALERLNAVPSAVPNQGP